MSLESKEEILISGELKNLMSDNYEIIIINFITIGHNRIHNLLGWGCNL